MRRGPRKGSAKSRAGILAMHRKHPKGHLTGRQRASAIRNLGIANSRRHHRATATKKTATAYGTPAGEALVPSVLLPVASSYTYATRARKLRSEKGAQFRLSARNRGARAKPTQRNIGARSKKNPELAGRRAAKGARDLRDLTVYTTRPVVRAQRPKSLKATRNARKHLREFRRKQRKAHQWNRKSVKRHHW